MRGSSQRLRRPSTRQSSRCAGRNNLRVGLFADDLKTQADTGFPEPKDEAGEQLSLQNYLQQLDPPPVAFSIKQKRPKTLDEAVAATIEMESYLPQAPQTTIAGCEQEDEKVTVVPVSDATFKAGRSV